MQELLLRSIQERDLVDLYQVMYRSETPKWTLYNAPYYQDYRWMPLDQFLEPANHSFFLTDNVLGIFYKSDLVGVVTRFWEDRQTRWLEIGIVIYDDGLWSKGLGYRSLKDWMSQCFRDFPEIERLGLTTWSGNPGMMKLAQKLGMIQEGCLRKVRYYQGYYYDSLKYGILREEFENQELETDKTL